MSVRFWMAIAAYVTGLAIIAYYRWHVALGVWLCFAANNVMRVELFKRETKN